MRYIGAPSENCKAPSSSFAWLLQIKSTSQAVAALHAAEDVHAYVHASRVMRCMHGALGRLEATSPPDSTDMEFVGLLVEPAAEVGGSGASECTITS